MLVGEGIGLGDGVGDGVGVGVGGASISKGSVCASSASFSALATSIY